MVRVRRYKDSSVDIQAVLKGIKEFLQETKDLNIMNEINGKIDGKPFLSLTAVKTTAPRLLVGALREITISLTGFPDDFLVEVHTGTWFANIAMPGVAGTLIAGPVGFAVGAGAPTIVAVRYERQVWNRIRELIKQNAKKSFNLEKVETY